MFFNFVSKKKYLFLIFAITTLSFSCARTATVKESKKTIQITFTVQGNFQIRNDLGYYVVFNAPEPKNNVFRVAEKDGPRMNGSKDNSPISSYEYKTPFTGKYPTDTDESIWTDFFYIGLSPVNTGFVIKQGKKNDLGEITIVENNFQTISPNSILSGSNGFRLEFKLDQLSQLKVQNLKNITCNIGISNSIDNGLGQVFDYWTSNSPFSIELEKNKQVILQKFSPAIMKKIQNRPDPVLPNNVSLQDITLKDITININGA
ncbi:MAG: hypothetical protein AABZ74_15920 [Cyanobacteriota bacterium]